MERKNKNIEELFLQQMEGYEENPSPGVWKEVSRRLWWKEFLRFNPVKMNAWYLGLGLALVTGVVLIPVKDKTEPVLQAENEMLPVITEVQSPDKVVVPEPEKSISDTKTADDDKRPGSKATEEKEIKTISGAVAGKSSAEKVDAKLEDNLVHEQVRLQAIAFFIAEPAIGCVPLKVNFTNMSGTSARYQWSFGDGGMSEAEHPVYIFDEPGIYQVSLIVFDEKNTPARFVSTIEVKARPVAVFEAEVPEKADGSFPVYFYNQSRAAVAWQWDFGDEGSSMEYEPVHYYEKAGNYQVKLKVWSEGGCIDSLVRRNIFEVKEPVMIFPTAFSPNTNGPGGGYYHNRESNNQVFHPFVEEQPVDYQLRVFNRQGVLVFESNDIQVGWDGYYRQTLQPAGVYVWKVRARFQDGQTLVKMGDVTMLWRMP